MSKLYCVYIQQEFDTYAITAFRKRLIPKTKKYETAKGFYKIIFANSEDDAKEKFSKYYDSNPNYVVDKYFGFDYDYYFTSKNIKNKLCIIEPKAAFPNYCFETLKGVMEPDNFMEYCKCKTYPIEEVNDNLK